LLKQAFDVSEVNRNESITKDYQRSTKTN